MIKKVYCIKYYQYRKIKNSVQYICDKTLVISIISGKCGSKDKGIFKEDKEESVDILKILGLINSMNE